MDGWYDLAVHGGGVVTLDYTKTGYLRAHRTVDTPWQEFVFVDDVVLLQPDAAATSITLGNANTQVVRGSAVSDDDGARRTTLLVEPNTQATIIRADGTTQPATSLTLRVTEFTVGNAGPVAMPAELPPTSGYTFAVQVTADEALAIGAREVTFATPVPIYLENFLNFPVGMAVPVGAFDVQVRAWIPQANGRIIKILSVSGGTATIDADGDGTADSDAALNALGIDVAERQQLATLYAANQTLWRAAVTNTRPYDFNYPVGVRGVDPTGQVEGGCTSRRSNLIACDVQVARQDVAILGAPFSLAYNSTRAPGAATNRSLDVTLTGATISPELMRVELEVEVGGRLFKQTFTPTANLTTQFTWDGKDAYGRFMQGAQPVTVRTGHVYPKEYRVPAPVAQSFGLPCEATTCVITAPPSDARGQGVRVQTIRSSLGGFDALALGLGGFTPTLHHMYDPVGRVLYRGDGSRRSAHVMPPISKTFAGNGTTGNGGDAGKATLAQMNDPYGLAVAPDGSLYIATSFGPPTTVRRTRPDGIIERFAGSDTYGNCGVFSGDIHCGDGGLAINAGLKGAFGQIALGPDGSMYIADPGNDRVRRVTPDGIIRNFAGTPGQGAGDNQSTQPLGDGGPATSALFIDPRGVAVAPDGVVYISDPNARRVRRVGTDGIITTIAGTGVAGFSGDGGPARLAQLQEPKGIALGRDGSLYIVDGIRLRRVSPSGIISSVIGGTGSFTAQGVPAITTRLHQPRAIAVSRDGALFITDHTILRHVGTDGIITTLAGRSVFSGFDPKAAVDVDLGELEGVAVGNAGEVYVGSRTTTKRVFRINPASAGVSLGEIAIIDGPTSSILAFSATGRHLRTFDLSTRTLQASFQYDAQNRLIGTTDAFGQVTQIQRDATGRPTGVLAPTGQLTPLTLDANGYLASAKGPDGFPWAFVVNSSGLLTSATDPNTRTSTSFFDAVGRLTSSTPAGVASLTSTTAGAAANQTISFTNAGERSSLQSQMLSTGGTSLVARDALGRSATVTENTDGSITATQPNGFATTSLLQPHPLYEQERPLETVTERTPLNLTRTARSGAAVTRDAATDSVLTLVDTLVTNGRVATSTYDFLTRTSTIVSAAGRRRTSQLNGQGLLARDSVAGVRVTTYSYNATGRLSVQTHGNRSTGFTYDALGRPTTIVDALGQTQRLAYDTGDRPTVLVNARGDTTRMSFDSAGHVRTVTPPGKPAHTFGYSSAGLVTTYTPPSVGDGAPPVLTDYDADGRPIRVRRPSGDSVVFTYDSTGRTTSVRTPETLTSYAYSGTTGQLSQLSAPTRGTLAFQYDGPLTTRRTWSGVINGNVATAYDNDFRQSTETVNNGSSIAFGYDADSRLTSAGSLAIVRDALNGRATGSTLGSVTTSVSYDQYGAISLFGASHSGTGALYSSGLLHDSLGRIVSKTEAIGGVTTVLAYEYDAAGHLATVRRNGVQEASYAYDANGNRTSLTTASGTISAAFDAQDRLITQGTTLFIHTASGELREKVDGVDTTRYSYGPRGELLSVRLPNGALIEYVHDPEGRRIGKRLNGTLQRSWLYGEGLAPVVELDAAGAIVSRFIYAGRFNVPEYMIKAGVTYRLVHDQLGSVRLVVNASTGAIAQRIDYDAWGEVTQNTAPDFQPFGFAGGLYDTQSGLVRFGVRDYVASAGRWTVRDPMLFEGRDANLYRYAHNDPVNRVDPGGLFSGFSIVGLTVAATVSATIASNLLKGLPVFRNVVRNAYFAALASTVGTALVLEFAITWGFASTVPAVATTVVIGSGAAFSNYLPRVGEVVLRVPNWIYNAFTRADGTRPIGNFINDRFIDLWVRQGARFESVSELSMRTMYNAPKDTWTQFGREIIRLGQQGVLNDPARFTIR